MGIIMAVTVVLFLVLAIFRPDLVRRGFLTVVEAPKVILGSRSPKELPPPVFDEVTDEEYYELVKRNVSDWVTDAELVATKQFDVDEAKAHKIAAAYLKEACACDICSTTELKPQSMREAVAWYSLKRSQGLSVPHPKFSKGGVVNGPGPTAIGQVMALEDEAKYNYVSRMGPYADRVGEGLKQKRMRELGFRADQITSDTIVVESSPQPPPDRTWLSYDGDDEDRDSYYENYGNYSVFHDMTNRTPRTSHEIGVARKLQQLKESTDQDTIRSIDGTVVSTKITQFSDEANRILRWGGIASFSSEDSLGYDPQMW